MAAAAVFAGAAAVALTTAQSRVFEFFQCLGSPEACQTDLSNLTESLEAMAGVLAVQALAAAAVALVAWIPWAAQPAMYVIATSLVAQLALIPLILAYARALLKCVDSLGIRKIPDPLVVGAIAIIAIALPFIHFARRKRAAA